MLATAQVPVAPITTLGICLTSQENQRLLRETSSLKPMPFSTTDSRRRRFVPTFFLLEIDGVTHQFMLRFRSGLKSFSLPRGIVLQGKDFEIVVFRRWTPFRCGRDYCPEDYPSFSPVQLKAIVLDTWREHGYTDRSDRLVEDKNYNLPPGSVVLSSRVAVKLLKERRKVA